MSPGNLALFVLWFFVAWGCVHALWVRESRALRAAIPLLVLSFAAAHQGKAIVQKVIARQREKKSFAPEAVALLEGLQASFEAGLTLEAAMRGQATRRVWRSRCGSALSAYQGARSAGRSLVGATQAAGEKLGGNGEARFLRAALASLASGAETGVELSSVAAAFAERLRSAQKMQDRALALSAQVRFQARLLLCAPFVLAMIMWVLRPGYVSFFVSTARGALLLGLMAVLHVVAFVLLGRLQRSVCSMGEG